MPTARGKFIVLYGINNIGKSTQAKLLVEKLTQAGRPAEYVKYPHYNVAPSGIMLNDFLRRKNFYNLTSREAQMLYTLNRTQVEHDVVAKLEQGITVVAEDYTGTGIAWGVGSGVDEYFLTYLNGHLLKEDLALLLDGERFLKSVENGHHHETNSELTNRVRSIHLQLAHTYRWPVINANQTIEQVQGTIWSYVDHLFTAHTAGSMEQRLREQYPLPAFQPTIEVINPTPQPMNAPSAAPRYVLQVSKVHPAAKLPTRAHADDAGLDLYADDHYTLYEGDRTLVKTGIRVAIPDGFVGLVWDKSGMAAKGLKTAGGVIDAGFRGEINVVAVNLSGDIFHIEKGQKIAQLLIQKIERPDVVCVEALEETKRGEGSFGSTGLM